MGNSGGRGTEESFSPHKTPEFSAVIYWVPLSQDQFEVVRGVWRGGLDVFEDVFGIEVVKDEIRCFQECVYVGWR